MSRKINPISLRLGITQVWDSSFQIYGKVNKNYYILFHKNFQIYQFFKFTRKWSNLLITKQSIQVNKNQVFISFYHTDPNPENNSLKLHQISDIFSKLFNLKIIFYYYSKSKWFSTIELISNYVQYLLIKNSNPSKVLQEISVFFLTQLNTKKIVNSTKGPVKVQLQGFKISLAGRFDNSKNQMAKSIYHNFGSLPLTSVKNYVEFLTSEIHTKLGTCGLQIWLFYKIY